MTTQPQPDDLVKMHQVICSDQMLGRDGLIRLHALNLAVGQRRDVSWLKDADADEGWLARETLAAARLYADWLDHGDQPATPE